MEEKGYSFEELQEMVKTIPVTTIKDEKKLKAYYKEKGLTKEDLAALLTLVITSMPDFRLIALSKTKDCTLTIEECREWHEKTQVQFIIIHRVNFIIHQAMITVYDLLEKENRLKFMVKKRSLQAEEEWEKYEGPRRKICEKTAWCTLQDSLRIAYDILTPYLTRLYEATRDYMIRLGWRDIEVKAWVLVALLLCKVARHSFRAFFKEFEDATGLDFSKCFAYADMSMMERRFAEMSDALGMKTVKDKYGSYDMVGFDIDKAIRVKWAWDAFITALCDNDLMDEAAIRAIGLNPAVEADYKKAMEEAETKQMEENTERLSEKFKVTKHKK